MAELADARDLKSLGPKDRTGSIPVFGTKYILSGSSSVVEHRLAKARVAGSNPVFRSKCKSEERVDTGSFLCFQSFCEMAARNFRQLVEPRMISYYQGILRAKEEVNKLEDERYSGESPSEPEQENPLEEPIRQSPRKQRVTLQNLKALGQMNTPAPAETHIHTLIIVGQIEGHMILPPKNKTTKYEHIIPQLVAIEQNPNIKGLLVILNTVGGDVEAGLAIAEMLESLTKATVSLVLGGGHSIGVPIAVSTDYSFIAETATMTIHPLRLTGMLIGVPQTYEYLEKMQDRIIKFVTTHSTVSEERFRELMFRTGDLVRDIGTVLVGRDAVAAGLINEIGGISQALKKLEELIELKNNPKRRSKR